MKNNFKIRLFGTGLDSYWNQFDELKETLTSNLDNIEKHSLSPVAYYFECADNKQYEDIAT